MRQNIGEEQLKLSVAASKRGDQAEAEDRAAKAAAVLQLALDHFRSRDREDKDMVTSSIREQRISALLRARNYAEATRFASESIASNPANQEPMGIHLKTEANRLLNAGQLDDTLKLIEAIKAMNPRLADQYLDQIVAFERQAKEKASAPRSAVGVGS